MPPAGRDGRLIGDAFLKKLSRTPVRRRRLKILKACVRIDEPWVEDVLWASLSDPGEDIRDYLIGILGGRRDRNPDLLRRRLAAPPWYARCAALQILGLRGSRDALPWVAEFLDDSNIEIRRCVAGALGHIGGREALKLLVRMMKDESPHVRAAAGEALGKASPIRFS
jgi:hypothetical protein